MSRAAAGAALLVWLAGCTPGGPSSGGITVAAGSGSKTASAAQVEKTSRSGPASGRWYTFSGGGTVAVDGPAAARSPYRPWTVQTRASGFLSIGATLYIALNGWGVITLATAGEVSATNGDSAAPARAFRTYVDRRIFGGRTVNGFDTDGRQILLHLYRNTVLPAAKPRSAPIAYVRFDPLAGTLKAVALPPSRKGWEAVDFVDTSTGRWAIAWKKAGTDRVEFRYELYDPRTGKSTAIDRRAFVAAYGFIDTHAAPAALRSVAAVASAMERHLPSDASAPHDQVLHILLRSRPFERTQRFREGAEKALEAGSASLATLPATGAGERVYVLLPSGPLLRSGPAGTTEKPQVAYLPKLPPSFSYTDLWTDGRLLVASWERQRFTEVGSAGIYLVPIDDLRWGAAE